MLYFRQHVGVLTLVLCVGVAPLLAQGPLGTISGTVRDSSGAVLPGAGVQVKQQETGRVRSSVADSAGRFRLAALEPGAYSVQAGAAGFRTAVRENVALSVGSEIVVDLALEVGQVTESVNVIAEVPLVQTTTAELSGLVGDKAIRELPLNGRSYDALAYLQPGVVQYTNSSTGTIAKVVTGAGGRMSVGGTPGDFVSFLLDGTDIRDHAGNTPGSVAGNNLGVDAILEFRVYTRNYSAEYGRTAGGVISAVTRSGANVFHGSAFEFLRNDIFDSPSYLDNKAGKDLPPFRRNQFGGTVGGPVIRDRTFFFTAYEGLRERLQSLNFRTVPSEGAHRGLVGAANVGVAPSVRPYLDHYPLPNGRDYGDGTAEYSSAGSNPTREDYGSLRIDHQFSNKHYLFGRMTIDDTEASSVATFDPYLALLTSRNTFSTLEWKTIATSNFLNVFRVSFNRTNPLLNNAAQPDDAALAFVPGRDWNLSFTVTGGQDATIGNLGHQNAAPSGFIQNVWEISDAVDYHTGAHSLRMGFNLQRQQNNNYVYSSQSRYTFGSVTGFLQGIPTRFEAQSLDSDPVQGLRQWMTAVYLQDDVKATNHLNFNFGLRYEFVSVPTEVHGNQATIVDLLRDTAVTRGPGWLENPSLKNFAPRFGFAWTPFGESGKTVLRGGAGIYHNQFSSGRFYSLYSRSGLITNLSINNPTPITGFPKANITNPPAGSIDLRVWGPKPQTPTVYQFNLTAEQQVGPGMVLAVGYGGSRGVHWVRQTSLNTRIPTFGADGRPQYSPLAAAPRYNPAFGAIRVVQTDAQQNYDSLQVQFNKRQSQNLNLQASYTYSSAITDSGAWQAALTANTPDSTLIPFDRGGDRSLASQHQRHALAINGTYRVPTFPMSGVASTILNGWEASGIFSAATGNPFTVLIGSNRSNDGNSGAPDRPNQAGDSNNPIAGVTGSCGVAAVAAGAVVPVIKAGEKLGPETRYFDPCAFSDPLAGFYGGLGRNTLIGPGRANVNFSLVKNFRILEGHTLTYRMEWFNLLNRTNFGLPNRTVFSGAQPAQGGNTARLNHAGNAGVIQELSSSARQMQFNLRYTF
ncbi:MAG: TonB-dependent receptor [Acidobacteria bacterium]|nr:TonB-dependent receptor [Acidobacteriota bacterium]